MKTRVFHLGDYRRATVGPGKDVPDDYFFVNGEDNDDYALDGLLLNHWSNIMSKTLRLTLRFGYSPKFV